MKLEQHEILCIAFQGLFQGFLLPNASRAFSRNSLTSCHKSAGPARRPHRAATETVAPTSTRVPEHVGGWRLLTASQHIKAPPTNVRSPLCTHGVFVSCPPRSRLFARPQQAGVSMVSSTSSSSSSEDGTAEPPRSRTLPRVRRGRKQRDGREPLRGGTRALQRGCLGQLSAASRGASQRLRLWQQEDGQGGEVDSSRLHCHGPSQELPDTQRSARTCPGVWVPCISALLLAKSETSLGPH